MAELVHLHRRSGPGTECDTECGKRCDSVRVAYRDLDPERVTCPECKRAS